MIQKKEKGYITIYLSLTTIILLSFILTLIEGIRLRTIYFQAETVLDIGINSIFAEYNRETLDRYGLLLLDTSYGTEVTEEENTISRLLYYMNLNFSPPGKDALPNYRDLTGLHADNGSFPSVSYATDDSGEVLKYQVVRYMKEKTGLSYLQHTTEAYAAGLPELSKPVAVESPAPSQGASNPYDDLLTSMQSSSLLHYVIKDVAEISHKTIQKEYASHRSRKEGAGLWMEQESVTDIEDNGLYYSYLMEHCGRYGDVKEDTKLDYEIEYLLQGKTKDDSNLKGVAEDIFQIRYVINAAYLFTDSGKNAEAMGVASVMAGLMLNPELAEPIKMAILAAWCYAETIQDVRIVFDGKKVPYVKDGSCWNTPLFQLLTFSYHLDEYKASETGMDYEDFLYTFLATKNQDNLQIRFCDIVEMNVRMSPGNSHFRIDRCIYQLEAKVNVSSKYGHGLSITQKYSYE